MGKAIVLIGPASSSPAPTPGTAEAAAFEFFYNRQHFGVWAPRPPVDRWRRDQREAFDAELRRLENRAAQHLSIEPSRHPAIAK